MHYYRTTDPGSRLDEAVYHDGLLALFDPAAERLRRPGRESGDLAAMLQFIFTLESLALSLGCERSQLVIAVRQSAPVTTDPTKLALLWSAECVLRLRDMASLRSHLDAVIDNELLCRPCRTTLADSCLPWRSRRW